MDSSDNCRAFGCGSSYYVSWGLLSCNAGQKAKANAEGYIP
jgi:hypothetical protein